MKRGRGAAKPVDAGPDGALPPQRTARVRNRLVVSVAVVGVAVLGAGAPAVVTASSDLTESQQLVSLSELNGQAVVLAYSLADERDAMTEFVAAGRTAPAAGSGSSADAADGADEGISKSRRLRVDRQISEIRADAPAALRTALDRLPAIRQEALTGRGSAMDTFKAYTHIVQELHAVSADLARGIPPRASDGPAEALPALGRAVEQASATRALLLAALSAGGSQPQFTSAAQGTYTQEKAALADFGQTAPKSALDRYANTVNGTEISTAERYLARLTDQPQLSPQDLGLDQDRISLALSGRIDRMRAVESALTTAETDRLAALRDDDVTALELRIGLAGACLLLAVGISMSAARSMTRPLAVLRLGSRRVAADPAAEESIRFTGRNDEFADVVRAVNELHGTASRLHARVEQLGDDRARLVDERQRLTDERAELLRKQQELTESLEQAQDRVHGTFINLAMRTLGLVERQLGVIEGLENREQDPERLETLFKLDHLATRMRRHSENLLVLAGVEHGGWHGAGHGGTHSGAPVPLLDVLRAAISEIERYDRVDIHSLPPHAQVAGFAADAISHLVAELLENATTFSPPDADVELSGWLLESGELMLSVQDQGIGMTAERLEELNSRLADPHSVASGAADDLADDALGLGLHVVARLSARHGVRVQLRQQTRSGVAAVVVLPKSVLPTRPTPAGPGTTRTPEKPSVNFPGSVAEVNAGALPTRAPALRDERSPADPAVAAAERAVAEDRTARQPDPRPGAESGVPAQEERAPAQGEPGVLRAEGPVVPAVGGPYAIGTDEHAHAGDEDAADGLDQPTQDLRLPHLDAEASQRAGLTDGPTTFGSGTAASAESAHNHAAPAAPAGAAAGGDRVAERPGQKTPEQKAPQGKRLTDKGLPKRTPKIVSPVAPEHERTGPVDAEALRRKLGGFHQGARDGRREAEREIVERTGEHRTATLDHGGTVEEARG